MSGEQYTVWFPEWGETADEGRLRTAYDAEQAAGDAVEAAYHEEPFEQPMLAFVRGPFGEETKWTVHPEPTVMFYTHKYREASHD